MSEQRGLRNPDTHGTTSDGEPYCESCGVCDEGWRCRCCLAAEVEALRARNETLIATIQRQDSTFERQMEEHEELEALRAQVQRVRESHWPNSYSFVDRGYSCGHCGHPYPCDTIRALDGDSDA